MIIVGMAGTFGSGCSFISSRYLQDKYGYVRISLSKYLRESYEREHAGITVPPLRSQLQDYGNNLRERNGQGYLAQMALADIDKASDKNYVIDSIRNLAEVRIFKKEFGEFFLLGVNADQDCRWNRVSSLYNNDHREFDQDEKRDREENIDYGQQVARCFEHADYIIINNEVIHDGNDSDKRMVQKVDRFVKLVSGDMELSPNVDEMALAAAHAASHRSSCRQRKVGAVILDNRGSIYASGYNEVPPESESCTKLYGKCYRGHLRHDFRINISKMLDDKDKTDSVYSEFKTKIKLMDYCRALHAEENAILSIVRNGGSPQMHTSVLYTTTFPCNLCANKVVEVGVKRVVYASPYPMAEAKEVLRKGGVKCEAFEGITYLGYFKMEGNFL